MRSSQGLEMSCSPENSSSYIAFIQRLQTREQTNPSNSPPDTDLNESNLRRTRSWAPDDAVTHCYNCHRTFSLFWRKHHCRACGRIFCDACTGKRIKLPRELSQFPSFSGSKSSNKPERVCDACEQKIDKLLTLSKSIQLLHKIQPDLKDLCTWACLSTEWNEAVQSIRGQHRELQYRLPWYRVNTEESNFLLRNLEHFAGHSKWLVLVFKNLDWQNPELTKRACDLLEQHRHTSCHLVQCRKGDCHQVLQLDEAVELFNANIPNPTIRKWVLARLLQTSDLEFECLVPMLTFELRQERHESAILDMLIERSKNSLAIRSSVYWNLVVLRHRHTFYRKAYNHFMIKLDQSMGEEVVWNELIRGRKIVKICEQLPDPSRTSQEDLTTYFRDNFATLSPCYLNKSSVSADQLLAELMAEFESKTGPQASQLIEIIPTVLPCSSGRVATAIDLQALRVKESATSPVVINFICQDNVPFELLYKRECLLKDQIAVGIIRLMDDILKRELGLDLHIVSYRVLPTAENAGLVEIIPNSETIHSILHRKNFTLLNWILEHANDLTVDIVRDNFVKSTAAYCVISYLLAVGDRHLDNIMVTENGHLFHIDYSFFMGFDPKPLAPYMRITQDIVDALGGTGSKNYSQFKEYCSKAYNCLRRHTNLFACLLRLITEDGMALDNGCFKRDRLEEEMLHRFVPGESVVEAELQLLNRLEDSYRSSTPQFCIDFWHYHSRESTLRTVLSRVPSWGFSSLWPFSGHS